MIYNIIELVIREAGIQKNVFFHDNYSITILDIIYRFKKIMMSFPVYQSSHAKYRVDMKMIPEVYLTIYSLGIVYGMISTR